MLVPRLLIQHILLEPKEDGLKLLEEWPDCLKAFAEPAPEPAPAQELLDEAVADGWKLGSDDVAKDPSKPVFPWPESRPAESQAQPQEQQPIPDIRRAAPAQEPEALPEPDSAAIKAPGCYVRGNQNGGAAVRKTYQYFGSILLLKVTVNSQR